MENRPADQLWSSMEGLHLAAYNADLIAVRAFAGTDVNLRDENGFTPLLWSCFRGAVGNQGPVIDALIAAGADPNAITSAGDSSCLMLAVQSGSLEAVQSVVEGGALLDLPADGVTPLMVAARDGNEEVALYLLQRGADPSVRCGQFSAADYATYGGHDGLAELLSTPSEGS